MHISPTYLILRGTEHKRIRYPKLIVSQVKLTPNKGLSFLFESNIFSFSKTDKYEN